MRGTVARSCRKAAASQNPQGSKLTIAHHKKDKVGFLKWVGMLRDYKDLKRAHKLRGGPLC